jgi:hypothetical protein
VLCHENYCGTFSSRGCWESVRSAQFIKSKNIDEPFVLPVPKWLTQDDFQEYLTKGSFAKLFPHHDAKFSAGELKVYQCPGAVQTAVVGCIYKMINCSRVSNMLLRYSDIDVNYVHNITKKPFMIRPDCAFSPKSKKSLTFKVEVGTDMEGLCGKAMNQWSRVENVRYVLLICVVEVIPCTSFTYCFCQVTGKLNTLKEGDIKLDVPGDDPDAVITLRSFLLSKRRFI